MRQVAGCKIQDASFKIQYAKCKVQVEIATLSAGARNDI